MGDKYMFDSGKFDIVVAQSDLSPFSAINEIKITVEIQELGTWVCIGGGRGRMTSKYVQSHAHN